MSQSIDEMEAEIAAHQRAADAAWDEYHRRMRLVAWAETRLTAARLHEKRVKAVDQALRQVG